jgi:prepilin-type N-terminal cleavage/methylation domain-containing protein
MDRHGLDAFSKRHGFALIEAMVALAIVTLALLLGMAMLLRQPRAQERLDAGSEALRALEASVETLRAVPGLPLDSRRLSPGLAYPEGLGVEGLQVWLESSPADGPEGLWEVRLEARYLVGREPHRKRLETMIWRSP